MENAIHQSLIRSSTTRGGAPRDTSSEKSPSRSASDKTSRARGRDGLDACFPDAAFARAPRGSRRSMPEPAVDASRNVCGDQGEGSAAFCALLPQCPIERSAPLPLIPGLVYRSPTVARSVTTGLSRHASPRARPSRVFAVCAAAGLGPPGVLGQPEGSTSSQGASEPQPDWHGVVILEVSKAAAGPGNRVRWTGARTAGLC